MNLESPETLAFLALAAVSVAVALFARRYARARVTYGFIWERIATRRRRPRFLAIARLVFGVLLTATILAGLVVSAAEPVVLPNRGEVGAGPPQSDVVILLDTSPSTVRRNAGGIRLVREISNRAGEHVAALGRHERAWVTCLQHGAAILLGPYHAKDASEAASALAIIEADFIPSNTSELVRVVRQVASAIDAAQESETRKKHPAMARAVGRVVTITDDDERFEFVTRSKAWPESRFPVASLVAEKVGSYGNDTAFVSIEAVGDGRARVVARGGERLRAAYFGGGDATSALSADDGGGVLVDLMLPRGEEGIRLTLDALSDPLPENNTLELRGQPIDRPTIGLVTPDEFAKVLMRARMVHIGPDGVPVSDRLPGNVINDPIVIAHGTGDFGVGTGVRMLVCIGELPPGIGELSDSRKVNATVSGLLDVPAWLSVGGFTMGADGIEIASMRSLASTESDWHTMFEAPGVGVIASAKRFPNLDVVYFASDGFSSGLLKHPSIGLMLRRILDRASLPPVRELERLPLTRTGDVIGLGSGQWRVTANSPYLRDPRVFDVLPSAEGSAGFSETWYPGVYDAVPVGGDVDDARIRQSYRVQWLADPEEMPFAGSAARLTRLEASEGVGAFVGSRSGTDGVSSAGSGDAGMDAAREQERATTNDDGMSIAHMLLLAVIGLMLIEWLLYWIGATD